VRRRVPEFPGSRTKMGSRLCERAVAVLLILVVVGALGLRLISLGWLDPSKAVVVPEILNVTAHEKETGVDFPLEISSPLFDPNGNYAFVGLSFHKEI